MNHRREPDGEYRGEGFTCPQCDQDFWINPSEPWPGLAPLCDNCVTVNQERNARMRAEQEVDTPMIARRSA